MKINDNMSSWSIEKIYIFQFKIKTLFALNNPTTHKSSKVKDRIKEYEITLLVIPSV